MPLLNTADAVYLGNTAVDKVYSGSTLVWSASTATYRDFEAYSDNQTATTTEWYRVEGTAPTYQNTQAYDGRTLSVFADTTGTWSAVADTYASMSDFYVRAWFYSPTVQAGNTRVIEPRTSTDGIIAQIRLRNSGVIDLLDSTSATIDTSTTSYNTASWFSIGAHIVPGDSSTCTVRLYNTPGSDTATEEISGTGDFLPASGTADRVYYGLRTTGSFTQSLYIGLIGYSDTDWVPAP